MLSGYDRKSLAALVLLVVSGLALGRGWDDLFGSGRPDWLLVVMWGWLAIVLPWRVSPGRDVLLLVLGFGGGALIETWGTWTGVWWYLTEERPPWWVIPAWSTTALAGERTATLIGVVVRKLAGSLAEGRIGRIPKWSYWIVLPLFALAMTRFSWPAASGRAVAVAVVTMAVVIASTRRPSHDLAAFAAGSLLGAFIEPWGDRAPGVDVLHARGAADRSGICARVRDGGVLAGDRMDVACLGSVEGASVGDGSGRPVRELTHRDVSRKASEHERGPL